MVVIRLARAGTKKVPFYRVVVTDVRSRRDGSFIEQLGFVNPVAKNREAPFKINVERAEYWVSKGAQCTPRIQQLIKQLKRQPAINDSVPAVAQAA